MESASDFNILELIKNALPSFTGHEEETQLGSGSGFGVGEGDVGDGEIETAEMGVPEFIKRDSRTGIGSDLSGSDLSKGSGN